MFGYNSRQTQKLVPTTVMIICKILECYCECWEQILRHCWGLWWQIFFSTRNNQMNTPINKYLSSLCCVSLVFVVIVIIFVLFGIVLQVYGTRCVTSKLCCRNKLTWIISRFQLWIVNSKIHQRKTFIIHQCQFVNQIMDFFGYFHYKSKSKW
jgi:glucan phosphoethanolaminetransferase (alkaline phosphatase superfamily)